MISAGGFSSHISESSELRSSYQRSVLMDMSSLSVSVAFVLSSISFIKFGLECLGSF